MRASRLSPRRLRIEPACGGRCATGGRVGATRSHHSRPRRRLRDVRRRRAEFRRRQIRTLARIPGDAGAVARILRNVARDGLVLASKNARSMPTARASDELGPSFGRVLAGALATVLVVGELSIGGVWDLLRIPYARETVTRLGYPTYVLVILGACKLPAAVVLMVPGLRVLKEWAYAGAFVSYVVTASSHFAVGDDLGAAFAPSVFAALVLVSKLLRAPVVGATARPVRGAHPLAYWLTTTVVAVACLFGGILWTLHAQP